MAIKQPDVGAVPPVPPALRNPKREYIIGGSWQGFNLSGGFLLAQVQDDVVRQFGTRVYDLMSVDNACSAATTLLKAGILSEGLRITPAVTAPDGQEVTDPDLLARIELSAEVYDSCVRVHSPIEETVHETLWELLDGMYLGCKLAENVFELADEGPDTGRQVPTVFRVKPNWSWAFRVDPLLNVIAVRAWTTEGWQDVEREHCTIFSWHPKDGDPRGTSIYRPAYTPFNSKLQAYPDYGEYLKKFASAALVIEAGPDQADQVVTDASGKQVVKTPQQQNLEAGIAFKNHAVLSMANGAKANIIQSTGNGQAFELGFDRFDREIFRSIILAARPMQESKHGSKADSESGLDIFEFACSQGRKALAGAYRRDFLHRYVALNWGERVARDMTPHVSFGASEHVSGELLSAFANAWSKGVFEPAHKPWIWAKLGAPVPTGWTPEDEPDPGDTAAGKTGSGQEGDDEGEGESEDTGSGKKGKKSEPEPEPENDQEDRAEEGEE